MFSISNFNIPWFRIKNGHANALQKLSTESFFRSVYLAANTRYRDRRVQVFHCRWLHDAPNMALCWRKFHKRSCHIFSKKLWCHRSFKWSYWDVNVAQVSNVCLHSVSKLSNLCFIHNYKIVQEDVWLKQFLHSCVANHTIFSKKCCMCSPVFVQKEIQHFWTFVLG